MPYGSVRKIFNNYSGLLKEHGCCDRMEKKEVFIWKRKKLPLLFPG
jgi:hypothetical protein